MLGVEKEVMGPVTVVRLEGDIDEYGATDLRVALVGCLRENQTHVVVNLEGVRYVSFMGMGILVERLRQFQASHGDMKLAGLNLYTDRLFRMAGVTNLFDRYACEEDAIQVYRQAA